MIQPMGAQLFVFALETEANKTFYHVPNEAYYFAL